MMVFLCTSVEVTNCNIYTIIHPSLVSVFFDVNFNVLIAQKIHMRYLGNLEHPMALELIDAIKKGQSVVLEISPKYYSTWDYRKQ